MGDWIIVLLSWGGKACANRMAAVEAILEKKTDGGGELGE